MMFPPRGTVDTLAKRLKDITTAVHLLRQHGVSVGYPMQTGTGEIIFAVGNDFILTAEQLLELHKRGELHPEGVLKLVGTPAPATFVRKKAASP